MFPIYVGKLVNVLVWSGFKLLDWITIAVIGDIQGNIICIVLKIKWDKSKQAK